MGGVVCAASRGARRPGPALLWGRAGGEPLSAGARPPPSSRRSNWRLRRGGAKWRGGARRRRDPGGHPAPRGERRGRAGFETRHPRRGVGQRRPPPAPSRRALKAGGGSERAAPSGGAGAAAAAAPGCPSAGGLREAGGAAAAGCPVVRPPRPRRSPAPLPGGGSGPHGLLRGAPLRQGGFRQVRGAGGGRRTVGGGSRSAGLQLPRPARSRAAEELRLGWRGVSCNFVVGVPSRLLRTDDPSPCLTARFGFQTRHRVRRWPWALGASRKRGNSEVI